MMTTRIARSAFFAALLGLCPVSPALADLILQPASASSNMGFSANPPFLAINQSGLTTGYTSPVTDFDSYIASDPTADHTFSFPLWFSGFGFTTGNFDFNLGGTFTIQSFALWNIGGGNFFGINEFDLLADDNAAFSSPTLLGSFAADANTGPPSAVLPEVFTFAPTTAAFVRMVINSNHGAPFQTGFGEAAFEIQSIPEPGSIVLLGLGAGLVSVYRWRRRRTAGRV